MTADKLFAEGLANWRKSNDNHSHSNCCSPPMYICVCAAVTDRAIRAAVAEGANSLDDLRIDLGVAMNCGSCAHAAEHVICETKAKLIRLDPYQMHGDSGDCERVAANAGVASLDQPGAREMPQRVWPILEVA